MSFLFPKAPERKPAAPIVDDTARRTEAKRQSKIQLANAGIQGLGTSSGGLSGQTPINRPTLKATLGA